MNKPTPFSDELENWLAGKSPKTVAGLDGVFGERSFATMFLLLMSLPALPLPTGGITHVMEIIVMLLALELIAGRRSIWLPSKWTKWKLKKSVQKKAIPFLIRRIRWLERYSRPRMGIVMARRTFRSLTGLIILALTVVAFLAPPFSGLDTLPSLAVVIISLSLIIQDIALFIVGLAVGAAGTGLVIGLGLAGKGLLKTII